MGLNKAAILDIASDWSLDVSELRAAVGKALVALSDAMDSLEAQDDKDLEDRLEDIANELYELVEGQEEE